MIWRHNCSARCQLRYLRSEVIDLTWQACHTYNIEAFEVGKLVKSKGLPYLHIESDYSNSDLESLKVRIEAMLEMVEK
ncbi:MAG: 2-hydroxyacyl-CoA dehydratase [Syntrophomonadaceae bacterium]